MLAGQPPSFNAGSLPPSMQQQSQISGPNFPNQLQSPVLPPNFQGNQQYQPPSQPQFPLQPPVLPPSFSGNQHPQAQLSSLQPPIQPPNVLGNQQQFPSQPPMMTNGTSMFFTNLHFEIYTIFIYVRSIVSATSVFKLRITATIYSNAI
jgi:hypothetical protein